MTEYETHQMVVFNKYSTGAEEYFCPRCGRRFIMQWPPHFKRITLMEGNPEVLHTGGTVEINTLLSPGDADESANSTDLTGSADDPYLDLWKKFFNDGEDG